MDDQAIETMLKEDYRKLGQNISISNGCKQRIEDIESNKINDRISNRINSRIRNRIIFTQAFSILLLLLFIVPTTAFAAIKVSNALLTKLETADLSDEQIIAIDKDLQEGGFTEEVISQLDSLQVNESGLTYGPDALGADLISVISEEGYEGYVYRTDFDSPDFKTPEEALAWQEANKEDRILNVYESDGKTIIGTFILRKSTVIYQE